MVDTESQDRTEQPTQARREEARRQGQIPRSRDLAVSLSLLAGFAGLYSLGPWLLSKACDTTRTLLVGATAGSGTLTPDGIRDLVAAGCSFLLLAMLPVATVTGGAVAASVVLQTGVAVRPSAVSPDPSRLSIRKGLQRVVSLRGLGRGMFTTLKILLVGSAAVWLLFGVVDLLLTSVLREPGLRLNGGDTRASATLMWGETCLLGMKLAGVLVVLGLLDYLHERWHHERDLRMTRAEVQEEALRLEGNREYKSRRRKEAGRLFRRARKESLEGEEER